MLPEVICTGMPVESVVVVRLMFAALVDTVRPETTVLPALSLSSARAAVPPADGVTESGVPERVAVLEDSENGGVDDSTTEAKTPVAPESPEVPITSNPPPAVCPLTDTPADVLVALYVCRRRAPAAAVEKAIAIKRLLQVSFIQPSNSIILNAPGLSLTTMHCGSSLHPRKRWR
jgi:hypothetical protein